MWYHKNNVKPPATDKLWAVLKSRVTITKASILPLCIVT